MNISLSISRNIFCIQMIIASLVYGQFRSGMQGFNFAYVSNDNEGYICKLNGKQYESKFKPYVVNGLLYDKLVIIDKIDEPAICIRTIKPIKIIGLSK